jgi:hypothetical protein
MDDFLSLAQAGSGVGHASPPSPGASVSVSRSLFGGVPEVVATPSLSAFAVEWGPSQVLIRDHTAICGGQYGLKKINCFCCALLKSDRSCPDRHANVKHPALKDEQTLQSSRIYFFHKTPHSNAVYAEPFVDAGGMSTQEITDLLAKVFGSWEEWREEALLRKAAREVKEDVSLLRTAVKAMRWTKEVSIDDDGAEKEVKSEFDNNLDRLGEVMIELKDLDTFALPGSDVSLKLNSLEKVVTVMQDTFQKGLKSLQLGFGLRLSGIESMLGTQSMEDQENENAGVSFRELLKDLQDQVAKTGDAAFIQDIVNKLFESQRMFDFSGGLRKAFSALANRATLVEKEVDQVRKDMMKLEPKTDSASTVNSFQDWLEGAGSTKLNTLGAQSSGLHEDMKSWKDVMESLSRRVGNLEITVTPGLKVEGEDISVAFMRVRFSSQDDATAYIEKRCNGVFGVTPGMLTDCYSIFYFLNKEIFETRNKLNVTDLHKVHSLGMPQVDVYHILAGVEHGLPDFFDSPASASKIYVDGKQGKKYRFSNIGTHEIWGPIGADINTVRKKADNVLTRYVKTKKLLFSKDMNAELKALLISMLDVSKDFVEAVFEFLTEEYAALYEHFGDGALCWDFACSCVEHVFKYEFEAARAVVTNPDVGDDQIGAKLFWQCLRTIAIQESFMRVGFKNHSSLSSAYSRFLLKQYQHTASDLSKMTKLAEGQAKSVSELKASLEAMDKRLRAAEGTANAASNLVNKMKRHND